MGAPSINQTQNAISTTGSIDGVAVRSETSEKGYVDPKEERAFVSPSKAIQKLQTDASKLWRLDLWFLSIGFLGYMFKYIDQTNIVSPCLINGTSFLPDTSRTMPMSPE